MTEHTTEAACSAAVGSDDGMPAGRVMHRYKPSGAVRHVQDLWRFSERRPGSDCWHWMGAKAHQTGLARIYTWCHDQQCKRLMSGPSAVWGIAHKAPLLGRIPMRTCRTKCCVNPTHIKIVADRPAMHAETRRLGLLVGTAVESRRTNIRLAQAAVPTIGAEKIARIAQTLDLPRAVVAAELGVSLSSVRKYRSRALQQLQSQAVAAAGACAA